MNKQEFNNLCQQGELLKGSYERPRVMLYRGQVVKFLYRKTNIFSRKKFINIAKKIKRYAAKLAQLEIPSITITSLKYYASKHCDILAYKEIPGVSLLDTLNNGADIAKVISELAKYVATAHEKGLFFGDLSLRNIIETQNQQLALIDIQDLKFYKKSVPITKRVFDLVNLFKEALAVFVAFGAQQFFVLYFANSKLNKIQQDRLLDLFSKALKKNYIDIINVAATKLHKLNLTCVTPKLQFDAGKIAIFLQQAEGSILKDLIKAEDSRVFTTVIDLIAKLHDNGVANYLWPFENIVLAKNGALSFSSIHNVCELQFGNKSLSIEDRVKDLSRIIKNEAEIIKPFGIKNFIELYLMKLPEPNRDKFYQLIKQRLKKRCFIEID